MIHIHWDMQYFPKKCAHSEILFPQKAIQTFHNMAFYHPAYITSHWYRNRRGWKKCRFHNTQAENETHKDLRIHTTHTYKRRHTRKDRRKFRVLRYCSLRKSIVKIDIRGTFECLCVSKSCVSVCVFMCIPACVILGVKEKKVEFLFFFSACLVGRRWLCVSWQPLCAHIFFVRIIKWTHIFL